MTITSKILNAAFEYDKRGWVLHPLSPSTSNKASPGKKPILNGWQHRKSNTKEELTQWFANDVGNIGLVCGEASGIVVVDVDHTRFEKELFNGLDVDTLKSSRTAGRGHIFFKYTDKIKSQKHRDLGFEILSSGSNAVLPPSKHVSGDIYKWVNEGTEIADFPDKLIERIDRLVSRKKHVAALVSQTRNCFKELWNKKPDVHGASGREMMLAFCTELKANGATLEDILYVSKIMYGDDFDSNRTTIEFNNSDKSKPWKCETISYKLPGYVQCDECNTNKKPKIDAIVQQVKMPNILDVAQSIHENSPYIYDRARCFWLWMDNHYCRVDETDIVGAVIDQTSSTSYLKRSLKGEVLDAIRITGRRNTAIKLPGNWIQFDNVVVDVKNETEFAADHIYFYTSPIPHNLGHSTDTPNIDQLFTDWVGEDRKQILYEICAYCMLPSYPLHRMFWFKGAGRNGKGRFMALVRRLIGVENTTSTDLERMIDSRFESAKLYKKLVAFVGETDHNLLRRTNLLKALTGEDPIGAEFKNKEPFDFFNTAKILIATNSVPGIEDKTDGWYARNIILDFPNQFSEGVDVIGAIDEWEIENLCRKCVGILKTLLENGEFSGEGTIEDKRNHYEEASNPIKMFIDNYCIENVDTDLPTFLFREAFVPFLLERGYRKMSDKEITMRLKGQGYTIKPGRFGDKTWRCIEGIQLNIEKKVTNCYTCDNSVKKSVTNTTVSGGENVTLVTLVTPKPTQNPIYRNQVGSSVTSVTSVTEFCSICNQQFDKEDLNIDPTGTKLICYQCQVFLITENRQKSNLKSQTEATTFIRDSILNHSKDGITPIVEVITQANQAGITTERFNEYIYQMKRNGSIFEPKPGYLKCV